MLRFFFGTGVDRLTYNLTYNQCQCSRYSGGNCVLLKFVFFCDKTHR